MTISPCVGKTLDHARYDGRIYSDKAPGLSILALPATELTGLPGDHRSDGRNDLRVWLVRLLTNGLAFVLLVFVIGRVAEGLVAGTGAAVAVTFALGTIAASLAATSFDQMTAAALCFGAFALAWRRRPDLAGLLSGAAVVVEYETAPIVAILGLYILATDMRRFWRFCLFGLPPLAILGAYDWAAFGSPLHASYRYVANGYAREQATGLFGISWPRWDAVSKVLVGDRGLLVTSPVLLAAAAGIVLLARRHRAEALVCAGVTAAGLLLEFGYFLPYGGVSPGPRFVLPALPFLAVGLAPVFARARGVTSTLMVTSVTACTALLVTWPNESVAGYRNTIWGEIVRALTHTHSRLHASLTKNLVAWAGADRVVSTLFVVACAAATCVIALRPSRC